MNNYTLKLVDLHFGNEPLVYKSIFKIKIKVGSIINKYKIELVVKGFSQ
jgi:hypothetical protein